ncbi:MAG TPA: hypothetical protein PKI11_19580 [Candidatus Hydrogenedentes bacterium]|nr:hypothetical protein [Candidatus Hydrogenedentota bacterium]
MRRLQWSVARLLLLLVVVCGALVLAYNLDFGQVRETFNTIWARVPDAPEEKRLIGLILGGAMTLLGVIGLVPLPRVGPRRSITFSAGRGNVTIQLDSTYRKINKMLNRMPEVDYCAIDIVPSADGQHLIIKADARLNKLPRQRARAIAQRVNEYIADAAMNFLGLEEVVSVDLNVQDFTIDVEEACKSLMEDADRRAVESLGSVFTETPEVGMAPLEEEALDETAAPPAVAVEAAAEAAPDVPEAVAVEEEAHPAARPLPPLAFEEDEEVLKEAVFDNGALPPLRDDAPDR